MRWRILMSIGRWQLLVGRCLQCGWIRVGIRSNDTWHSWPNARPHAEADSVQADVGQEVTP